MRRLVFPPPSCRVMVSPRHRYYRRSHRPRDPHQLPCPRLRVCPRASSGVNPGDHMRLVAVARRRATQAPTKPHLTRVLQFPGAAVCECPGPRRFSNHSHVNVRARGGEARPTPTPRTAEGWVIWLTKRTPVTLERVTGTRRASPSAPAHECPLGLPLPGPSPAPSGGLTTNSRRTGPGFLLLG